MTAFSGIQLHIIEYCAKECERQGSGEFSVYDMVNAWDYMLYWVRINKISKGALENKLTIDVIEHLGKLVEPIKNADGFRTIPIGVNDGMGGWIAKAPHERVRLLLSQLIDSYYDGNFEAYDHMSQSAEDQFYFEYENIHPFVDGNGRTGKIIYNFLRGRLEWPAMPPNFWGSNNP